MAALLQSPGCSARIVGDVAVEEADAGGANNLIVRVWGRRAAEVILGEVHDAGCRIHARCFVREVAHGPDRGLR